MSNSSAPLASSASNAILNATKSIGDATENASLSRNNPVNVSSENLSSNQPPALLKLSSDMSSPQSPGTAVFWRAEASDSDGDRILYRFLLDGQVVRKWSKSGSWSWSTRVLPAKDYNITVQARDGGHAPEDSFDSSLSESFVLRMPNSAPQFQSLQPNRSSPQGSGASITWTARATDAENDEILYKFLVDGQEQTGWSSSNSWIWNTSSYAAGEHRIRGLIRDGSHAPEDSYDGFLEASFNLSASNQIPVLQTLEPDRSSPQSAGASITWTAKAGDAEGDKILYKFQVDGLDQANWSSSNSWIWNTSDFAAGDHKVAVLVRDGRHAQASSYDAIQNASFTLQAPNKPPVLEKLEPDKTSPQVQGATVSWKASARDPDGDKVQYRFLLNGRAMNRWSETDHWNWSTKDLSAGDYRISVQARDGNHASEESGDCSLDSVFSLISEIDQQIDQMMKKKGY
jgi:hypothetical protein